jgi:hypothetical protein
MVGRALRLHPGKDHMVAIDVADVTGGKSLVSVAALAGLPPKFNPKGGDVYEMAEELEEIDPRLHRLATDRENLEKVLAKVKSGMSVAEIDLFALIARDETLSELTSFTWLSVGEDRWSIRADKEKAYDIHVDALGRYVLTQAESKAVLRVSKSKKKAFVFADHFIAKRHREELYIIDASSRWRSAPASEKQLDLIAKLSRGTEIP